MDLGRFEQATLTIQKSNGTTVNATLNGKVRSSEDAATVWAETRPEFLALAIGALPGSEVAPGGEDAVLGIQKKTIQATFRLTLPTAPKA